MYHFNFASVPLQRSVVPVFTHRLEAISTPRTLHRVDRLKDNDQKWSKAWKKDAFMTSSSSSIAFHCLSLIEFFSHRHCNQHFDDQTQALYEFAFFFPMREPHPSLEMTSLASITSPSVQSPYDDNSNQTMV